MKKLILLLLFANSIYAQLQPLSTPNAGGNKKATLSEFIGFCEVKLTYSRPAVKGREGKIWGTDLAHFGLKDLQFGSSKAAPWRVGANECTTITFSTEVEIEGQKVKAGTYGLFMELGETENYLILNKNSTAWGSYSHNPTDDVLKVKMKLGLLATSVERMKFDFENQNDDSATLALSWEKRKMSFDIKVDIVKVQFESFKRELETPKGFSSGALLQASSFCLQNNYEMEQGLKWAERASQNGFPGERNFNTLNNLANFYRKMDKESDAEKLMKEALPLGTQTQVNVYARSLIAKNPNAAFEIYKSNYDKNPTDYASLFGMVRGNWAIGEKTKAVEFARKAMEIAPVPAQKAILEQIIKDIESGKAAN